MFTRLGILGLYRDHEGMAARWDKLGENLNAKRLRVDTVAGADGELLYWELGNRASSVKMGEKTTRDAVG